MQFEHLPAPHTGKKGQQEHIAHIAGWPCAGAIQKAASFFRRQMLNNLIVLNGHFDLKGKIGAAVGLDAKIDDAPQKLKSIPESGRFAFAQGFAQLLHHLGRDFRDASLAEQRFEVFEVTVAIRGQPFEGRPLDVKICIRNFGKGLVFLRLFAAEVFGGFDFFAMSDGLYPISANFRRHVRPVSFGNFAYLFPDEAAAGFKRDVETQVRRAIIHF